MASTGSAPLCVPIWSMKLRHKIRTGLVTVGKYDGERPGLTCATDGGKVFVHDMEARQKRLSGVDTGSEYQILSLQTQVTALLAGSLAKDGENAKDSLFVGSPSSLQAYNVYTNIEHFYKDVLDGVQALTIGHIGDELDPLVFAGGNCSVQGVDIDGNDRYWTVTGDNVQALAVVDIDGDSKNELLVGSDDYDIRVFKDDEMIQEISEVDAVTNICPLYRNAFAYTLMNGSVGAYGGSQRYWRIKARNRPTSLLSFDMDQDGVPEVISGWSKGKVDVRRYRTGELVMKANLPSGIAGLVKTDYTSCGTESILCCCEDGDVKCFAPEGADAVQTPQQKARETEHDLQTLRQQRQVLLDQMHAASEKVRLNEQLQHTTAASTGVVASKGALLSTIHNDISIQCSMELVNMDTKDPSIALTVGLVGKNSGPTMIKSIVLFAEGLFENESHHLYVPQGKMRKTERILLFPNKDMPIDVLIKVIVGSAFSKQFHVFELVKLLPRFSLIVPQTVRAEQAGSMVKFTIPGLSGSHFQEWVMENFLVTAAEWKVPELHEIRVVSLRHDSQSLLLQLDSGGQVTMFTNEIQLAGDLIMALAAFLHVEHLDCECYFPAYEQYVGMCLQKVEEQRQLYQRLRAEIADHSNLIRGLVVRAEDARINLDMQGVRQAYKSLQEFNIDLVRGHNIRCGTHEQLLELQRQLNVAVQNFAKLRVGKYKTTLIADCRDLLKKEETQALFDTLRGHLNIKHLKKDYERELVGNQA